MVIKKLFFYLIVILIPIFVLEGIFRMLPVSSPPYIMPVSSVSPVAHFQPNIDYTYSKGWNFPIIAKKRTNNYGYNHQSNYKKNECDFLLMVIGDSYVEAQQVDSGKSVAEVLNSQVGNKNCVYSIGLSGAPLSQYLVFAEFSKSTFHPDTMAFVIVGNDFDESLLKYKAQPGSYYFKEAGEGFVLQRIDYKIPELTIILRKSAFIRYLVNNLNLRSVLDQIFNRKLNKQINYVGNVPAEVEEQRIIDSKRAIDEFLLQLPSKSGLDSDAIVFVVDGMRPALYSHGALLKAKDSYFAQMRRYFKNQANLAGYEVIDMQPAFIQRHKLDNSKFEFHTDGHWNELGHNLAAKEMLSWVNQKLSR